MASSTVATVATVATVGAAGSRGRRRWRRGRPIGLASDRNKSVWALDCVVADADVVRRFLEQHQTWEDWARVDEPGALTPAGVEAVKWAAEVVAEFYTDEWFQRNLERWPNPLLSLYDHPLSRPMAAVRHVERAARIALVPPAARQALSEGTNGIRRSNSWDEFDHLDVVLEVIGLALRDSWQVECEVPTGCGRRPDIRVTRSGFSYSIEVTTQGFDRSAREEERQSERLRDYQLRIECGRGVGCAVRIERLLSEEELQTFVAALDQAALATTTTGDNSEVDLAYATATVRPGARRPGTTSYEGPAVGVDLWPRFAKRLCEKAQQVEGAGRGWIRIDEGGGLIAFTPVYHLAPVERLSLLIRRISEVIAEYPHVEGVIISHGAGPDWTPLTREVGVVERTTSSAVWERRLPGSRRRTTYVVRTPRRGLLLPVVVDPARWYNAEPSWLDWALHQLGIGPVESLVRTETTRRLLP